MSPVITEEIIARQPPEAQAIILALVAENAELRTRIEELERQVRGRTPQNSSLPSSTQHPHARPQSPRRKSKRKRGGQPGHEKHERPLIPSDECDDVQPLKPIECRRCGAKLSGNDPEPLRHQVWDAVINSLRTSSVVMRMQGPRACRASFAIRSYGSFGLTVAIQ
jgi:transposase